MGRATGRLLRRNRYVDAGIEAGKVTLQHTSRTLRTLVLEISGFVFCVFAVAGIAAVRKEFASLTGPWFRDKELMAAMVFSLLFIYFGVTAFIRARRTP